MNWRNRRNPPRRVAAWTIRRNLLQPKAAVAKAHYWCEASRVSALIGWGCQMHSLMLILGLAFFVVALACGLAGSPTKMGMFVVVGLGFIVLQIRPRHGEEEKRPNPDDLAKDLIGNLAARISVHAEEAKALLV